MRRVITRGLMVGVVVVAGLAFGCGAFTPPWETPPPGEAPPSSDGSESVGGYSSSSDASDVTPSPSYGGDDNPAAGGSSSYDPMPNVPPDQINAEMQKQAQEILNGTSAEPEDKPYSTEDNACTAAWCTQQSFKCDDACDTKHPNVGRDFAALQQCKEMCSSRQRHCLDCCTDCRKNRSRGGTYCWGGGT